MKKILITGANSYIGTSFEKYIKENHPNEYQIDTLDMKDPNWRQHDFSGYNSVFHVAGVAHQKETKENSLLYYKINRDLAIETAKKVKSSNVKQLIFMSSMSVYGMNHNSKPINLKTPTLPKTNYGKSKLEAELEIMKLQDNNFNIIIVRPPMVYGYDCPGNLTKLISVVKKIRVFPKFDNKRSSISIEKLCKYLTEYLIIGKNGIYIPQNDEYMCTYKMVKKQMKEKNIRVYYTEIFNPIIKLLIGRISLITKIFGDLTYEK